MPAGRQFGLQIVKTIPDTQFYLLPVVQTCPLYLLAVQRKPQRPDEMQIGSGGDTRAADIAGVPVNLRRHENYVSLKEVAPVVLWVLGHFYASKVGEIVARCVLKDENPYFITGNPQRLYPLPAIWTKLEIVTDFFTTIPAGPGVFRLLPVKIRSRPVADLFAAVAHDKWRPFFDSEYRNKKQAEVVVRAPGVRLIQAAYRATAWILIQNFCFG